MQLKGSQFLLRGWKQDDMFPLQRHADNINIARFLFDRFPSPYTLAAAESWVTRHLGQDPLINFAIDINGIAVGAIGFEFETDIHRKTATFGYWLGQELWGRGIMSEATTLITDHIFKTFDIIRIQANVNSDNPASMRVLEKAGFIKEGILRNAIFTKRGEILDEHVYALLK